MRSKLDRLKDNAWDTFSKYIRLRDPYCVSCIYDDEEKNKKVLSQQAGHFHHNCLDFDEENVNGQCIRCNHFKSGNLAPYSIYLLKKLGKKKFEALYIRHFRDMKAQKHDEEYYQNIVDTYKNKIKELSTPESSKIIDINY